MRQFPICVNFLLTALVIILWNMDGISQSNIFQQKIDNSFMNRHVVDTVKIFHLYEKQLVTKDSPTIDSIIQFHKLINQLVKFEKSKSKVKGNVSLGFSGQEAFYNDAINDLASQYNVSSGIEFTVGSYPGELKVKSKIDISVNNSDLTTNLSNQEIGYDRYLNDKTQGYIYLGRFTDKFISLESRYEAGIGVVFDFKKNASRQFRKRTFYQGNGKAYSMAKEYVLRSDLHKSITHKGQVELEKLVFDDEHLYKRAWMHKILKGKKEDVIFQLVEDIQKKKESNLSAIQKDHSKWRASLLMGLYTEIEEAKLKGVAKDTLSNGIDFNRDYDVSLPSTQTWRLMLRPKLEFQNNHFQIFTAIYGKFKIFRDYFDDNLAYSLNLNDVSILSNVDNPAMIKNGFDYRIDALIGVNINYKPITISITYNYYYDNLAPQVILNNENVPALRTPQIASARNTHGILDLKFKYVFN